jgi:hypothetical protein
MESCDKAELERLRSAMASTRAAAVAWRELLVESLGNCLCGDGPGPTPEDIDTLASLEEAAQQASRNYVLFLLATSAAP